MPVPYSETDRLLALRAMEILDTGEEEAFDRLTQIAAAIFDVPTALISLVDDGRQWFKSRVGFDLPQTSRDVSFCSHALGQHEPLVIPDAAADARFKENPLVKGQPHIRFYAGAQLRTGGKHDLGTFCILDSQPRPELSAKQLTLLEHLAATATLLIEQRRMVLDYEAHAKAREAAEEQMRGAKEEAEAATAGMRALFSRISHDLRTPLAAIMGFSELLADSPLAPEQKQDIEEVQRAAQNLLVMVDSLLQVARSTPAPLEERA